MKVRLWLSALLFFLCADLTSAAHNAAVSELEVFVRPGCPYCEAAKLYLIDLQRRRPGLVIRTRDISQDPRALQELRDLAERAGVQPVGVPAFYLDGRLIVGFVSAEITGKEIEALLSRSPSSSERADAAEPESVELPLLGRVHLRDLGLPLFTIVIGIIDGFNPCATWVLLFLLSMLLNLRDRRKMLLIGGVFVAVSGLVYFAFMAAWLNLFLFIGISRITQFLLGAVAAAIGLLNVKDFLALGGGISVAIPEAAKPSIYARVRRVLYAENVLGALAAVVSLAVLVNLVELLCTAGLPAVYTRVLTLQALPAWGYYGYLALYNVAYMADDSLMLAVAVVTLSREKLQERGARWLKLISGIVMLILGLALMLKPAWLGA
jgi:glutaredoxin